MRVRDIVLAALFSFCVAQAAAQPSGARRCDTDSSGVEVCRYADGTVTRTANGVTRSSDGAVIRESEDSSGAITQRSSDGTVTRITTDSSGNTVARRSDGVVIRGATDSSGVTTYRGSDGSVLRCRTDSSENELCREGS